MPSPVSTSLLPGPSCPASAGLLILTSRPRSFTLACLCLQTAPPDGCMAHTYSPSPNLHKSGQLPLHASYLDHLSYTKTCPPPSCSRSPCSCSLQSTITFSLTGNFLIFLCLLLLPASVCWKVGSSKAENLSCLVHPQHLAACTIHSGH